MRTPQPENDSGASSVRATRPARSAVGDAGEQALAGVGGAHAAGPFPAVEGQGVGVEVFAPEGRLEALPQRRRLAVQFVGPPRAPQDAGQQGGGAAGRVDVALDLAQGDGSGRGRAVGVEDRVVRILPSLVDEALRVAAGVLDEAVAVGVAVVVDPAQGGFDVGPDRLDERPVGGAFVVGARQEHEQRRGVDAAVVAAERDFAEGGHLAAARLVEDLARLGVALGIDFRGLVGGQIGQDAAGQGRVEPEAFQSGNDAVAAEGRAEPGDAGVGIRPGRRLRDHHVQVGPRPVHPVVEAFVAAAEDEGASRRRAAGRLGFRPGRRAGRRPPRRPLRRRR